MRSKKRQTVNLGALWVLVGLVIVTFAVRQVEVLRIKRQMSAVQDEISFYLISNGALEKQIETLNSDDYVEKIAREKLGLVLPGEVQYIPFKDLD